MMFTLLQPMIQMIVSQAAGPDAAAPSAGPLGDITSVVPFVLMFGVLYFLLLRPANKQRKEQQEMLNQLKKDDEIVTSSGMYGKIASLDEKVAVLEIADKVKVRILRDRIAGRWSPTPPPTQAAAK